MKISSGAGLETQIEDVLMKLSMKTALMADRVDSRPGRHRGGVGLETYFVVGVVPQVDAPVAAMLRVRCACTRGHADHAVRHGRMVLDAPAFRYLASHLTL